MPAYEQSAINLSRRGVLKLAGAGLAATALAASPVAAQTPEDVSNVDLNLVRRGTDKKLDIFNMDRLEEQAKQIYGHGIYVFVANGSGKQWTLAENQRSWGDYAFVPQRMRGVVRDKIDLSVDLLGLRLPHPFIITPFGSHGLHHPLAEVATARGIAKSGGLLTVSSSSTASMEDIAKVSDGPKWFQIYLTTDDGFSRTVLQRAKAAGFKAIVLTVDAIGQGSSDEYMRLGNPRPWLPYGNFPDGKQPAFKTNLSWADVEMIRNVTGLPVVVKGITRPEDARSAIAAGAAGIQVSNHGGRALDGTAAGITVLPSIAEEVKGEVPLILDSGIRRGTDG
ncbi:alpha-hydroxy-acid oxidizing protein [Pseudomonas alkylphenolica]|uniref:L-lactate oxidase n=1 Tax=Pseudomonas alkylphenolica TaxID=237609 RepID=A0A077FAK0_9PSED|nr:alpha-hydroxy-acid oxidizing protein [Pseudomonas alkylphenolica]AIL62333.1 L-lactate oxidase [Pseudomonas alkylphenolica]